MGPAGWNPEQCSQEKSPTFFSCPCCTEQTHGVWSQCWMLSAQGSDSFCCWGLWVWMSHSLSSWQQQLLLLKGFCSCPARHRVVAKHSWSWSAALHLITSGHKPALKVPASSLGFLEIQWLAWQADTQPTGLVKSAQQWPLHRGLHDKAFAAMPEGGGSVFNLCFSHLHYRCKRTSKAGQICTHRRGVGAVSSCWSPGLGLPVTGSAWAQLPGCWALPRAAGDGAGISCWKPAPTQGHALLRPAGCSGSWCWNKKLLQCNEHNLRCSCSNGTWTACPAVLLRGWEPSKIFPAFSWSCSSAAPCHCFTLHLLSYLFVLFSSSFIFIFFPFFSPFLTSPWLFLSAVPQPGKAWKPRAVTAFVSCSCPAVPWPDYAGWDIIPSWEQDWCWCLGGTRASSRWNILSLCPHKLLFWRLFVSINTTVLPLQNPRSCNKTQGFTQHCRCEGLHGNFSGFCVSALKTKLISSEPGSRSHTWILSKRQGQQLGCARISSPHIMGHWDLPWAPAAISAELVVIHPSSFFSFSSLFPVFTWS